MIIFAHHINPRLSYTLNHILNDQFGIIYRITDNPDDFIKSHSIKLNYSNKVFEGVFQLIPEGLLNENSIRTTQPMISSKSVLPIIFKQEKGDFPFDIFAAVFWFLARYEEYQEYTPDTHNRFPASQSYAFKNKFLDRPIVDEWIGYFGRVIKQHFPEIEIRKNKFKALTTIDVDSPWCYKNKGVLRNMAGCLRDFSKADFDAVKLRLKVLRGKVEDPWFTFDWLVELMESAALPIQFFIHVGDYGTYDKTVDYRSNEFAHWINSLPEKADLGLHPSYKAATNKQVFSNEISRLSTLINDRITKSRQHFLVFSVPDYYPNLRDLGITEDFSMGFADKNGFRAGTCNAFYFFDLNKNEETKLRVHPFAVMDRTLKSYENLSNQKALETIKYLIDNVKKVEGTFVSLWHNESLSNSFEWEGWHTVFLGYIEYLATNK